MQYFCYQGNDYDCGFASLKMLLASLNKNKNFLNLNKPLKRDHYTFADLILIAKEQGLSLGAFRYNLGEDVTVKTPFLAMLDGGHLVLVKDERRNGYLIYDPGLGVIKMKEKEFLKRWSGEALEVMEFAPRPCNLKQKKILPLKNLIVSTMIASAAILALLAAFFFVKDDEYIFVPLIFLAAFSVGELVEKWYLIKEINFFDNEYIPKFFSRPATSLKANYKEYLEFKNHYFSFGRKIYSAAVLIVVIMVALIINNPINSFAILFLLILAVTEKLFFKEKDDDVALSVKKMEDTLIKSDNNNLISDLLAINQTSNQFALKISLRKCINTFIIIILSYLMMLFNGSVSVNFILFHFGVFYLLYNNFGTVISFGESHRDYGLSKARFLDKCNL